MLWDPERSGAVSQDDLLPGTPPEAVPTAG